MEHRGTFQKPARRRRKGTWHLWAIHSLMFVGALLISWIAGATIASQYLKSPAPSLSPRVRAVSETDFLSDDDGTTTSRVVPATTTTTTTTATIAAISTAATPAATSATATSRDTAVPPPLTTQQQSNAVRLEEAAPAQQSLPRDGGGHVERREHAWKPPPSQAKFGASNPSGRAKPPYKLPRENFLRARAKTWEVGTPLLTGPYPDEFVPYWTAPKRPLKRRKPYSLPTPLWPSPTHVVQNDAVLALAVNYRIIDYVRFVGSLRRSGFGGDIVLAVAANMEQRCKQCKDFLMAMDVIAYPVAFNCSKAGGRGSVKQSTSCEWHQEQDIALPLAIIRHELYLSWASLYSRESRLLILDFRDTFFQRDPFESLPLGRQKEWLNPKTGQLEKYPFEQMLVLEHWPYKRMSNCPFNAWWVRGCWGMEEFKPMRNHPILCSGSYFGTRDGMIDMETELLDEVRATRCHEKGVPSDQGYVNYLYWAGRLPFATHEIRGEGIVNTVGALMAKNTGGSIGPLGTWFKIISRPGHDSPDDEHGGFVLDNDNRTHSAVVHQWDRFYDELYWTVDSVLECRGCYTSKVGHPPFSCACFKHGCACN